MLGHPRQHLVVLQVPQSRVGDLVPGPGGGDGRALPPAQRVRRDGGLGPVVLAPVQEHLAGPQALGHRGGHQVGHGLLQLLGHPPGQYHRALAADRFGELGVEVQTLAPAGQRVDREADIVHQVADGVGHLAHLRHGHALAGIEIEYQSCCGAGLSGLGEAPLRHMDLKRGLLGDPCQAGRAVDDRIGGIAGSMLHGRTVQPVGCRTGQLLFEECALVDAVRPALPGHRPAGDVRKHHLGNAGVVAEDVGLGGAGGRIQHLVGIGQLHTWALRRAGGPHVVHHPNVLPAATLDQ